ncbi:MAG: hypothetical protein ABS44_07350 [Chryseobacterium sp. SCN 40-13]|nr:MAG: hypothetical protein ABS44_07350 [Chryseobacterium sp. SCN 40-13]
MKTILVPTDYSDNSKAGLKFALQWASREEVKLLFMHVLQVNRESGMSEQEFHHFIAGKIRHEKQVLETFIQTVFAEFNIQPKHYAVEVVEGFSADTSLLAYCDEHPEISYICISTRGASGIKKMLGTNTGNLITTSEIPVMAVPFNNQENDLNRVLYASDLMDYPQEIEKVMGFAKPLKAEIEILHFSWPYEDYSDDSPLRRDYEYGFKLSFPAHDVTQRLMTNLHDEIREKKPSVVVMFTHQEKKFWEKIFSPSKTEQLSFRLDVPLLVFRKEGKKQRNG